MGVVGAAGFGKPLLLSPVVVLRLASRSAGPPGAVHVAVVPGMHGLVRARQLFLAELQHGFFSDFGW